MNQLQDIIGSIIIGGIVLLMLIVFNGNIMESSGTQTFKTIVQGNLTNVTNIMEYDFRKMGYRLSPSQDTAISYADDNKIVFRGDIDDDGSVDVVQYYVDNVGAGLTANPNDLVLHRRINGGSPINMYVGTISLSFQYYGANDAPITTVPVSPATLPTIKGVKVSLNIQSKDRFYDTRKGQYISNPFNDTSYAGAYWQRIIKPQNVR